ncbi:MAG TPA: hypothetical protein VHD55_00760 [Candidatus Paceibacterota bacterium]|nr:hypothetical protein [Candidatus Paceibacterota bacterium]
MAIWLPYHAHLIRIGLKHGWPSQKRAAIARLFLDGTLKSVWYAGGSLNPDEEFVLTIIGQFGAFVRTGTDGLRTMPASAPLPAQVADAFEGYIDSPADVVWLLWYLPFLEKLQSAGGENVRIGGRMPQSLAIAVA